MRFARYAWFTLAYASLVVLFGAFVRASHSGDGCGQNWPLCYGQVVPPGGFSAAVEWTHRASSGLSLLFAAILVLWSRRIYGAGHPIRRAAGFGLVFTLVSAGIGVVLVLAQLVNLDRSVGRVIAMPLHLMNTFFLLGAFLLAAYWASGGEAVRFRKQGGVFGALCASAGALFLLGMSGAVSAMGKTAFAPELSKLGSFWESLRVHTDPSTNPILRGGVIHPLLATSVGLLVIWVCGLVAHLRSDPGVVRWARINVALYAAQFAFGVVNVVAMAPLFMQILHLALGIANWLALVMLSAKALSVRLAPVGEPAESGAAEAISSVASARPGMAQLARDYFALTKPRVISLLLFVTIAAMFIAAKGWPGLGLILVVTLGGYMAAGSAHTLNMVLEPDLDTAMGRTANRPMAAGRISNRNALIYASILGFGSFAILWAFANLLAAVMAWCGLVFYVLIYTIWLKRRTWHNIVIGGAAGSFPPLVGWAAVTGELSPFAWCLFAIIFAWTPVHFWALALMLKDDYARAGVPMLPVVRGERVTVVQITLYAFLTALVSVAPLLQREVGWVYFAGSVLLNVALVAQSVQLLRVPDRPHARSLFKYSMVYLALIFVMFAVDRVGMS